MSIIDRPGFKAVIEGKNQKIQLDCAFMDSKVQMTASLRLAEIVLKYLPTVAVFYPAQRMYFDEAKRLIAQAIMEAR